MNTLNERLAADLPSSTTGISQSITVICGFSNCISRRRKWFDLIYVASFRQEDIGT